MGKILQNASTMHEHYCSFKYNAEDFPRVGSFAPTAVTTTTNITSGFVAASGIATAGNTSPAVGKKLFVVVNSVTDNATAMTVTYTCSTNAFVGTLPPHAPIDCIVELVKASTALPLDCTGVLTVTGATVGCSYELMVIDDAAWSDLGQNFNETVSFAKGVMLQPIPRGWDATAFSKRVRVTNNFSLKQMYSSQFEGVSSLRGKTICIKDEVKEDGSANVREVLYAVQCAVQSASIEIGAGGGETMVDQVQASGYFKRLYTLTLDTTSLGATA